MKPPLIRPETAAWQARLTLDDGLLEWFNRELAHVRERALEFGRDYPKVAGRLGIQRGEIEDPYIQYLLESFAYMTARIQRKREAAYPEFTQQLLGILFPQFMAQIPSLVMLGLTPASDEGTLNDGFVVPRGSLVDNELNLDISDRLYRFSTTQDVTLWPLELQEAQYFGSRAMIEKDAWDLPAGVDAQAGIKLAIHVQEGLVLQDLSLKSLDFYIAGAAQTVANLYETCHCNTLGVSVRGGENMCFMGPEAISTIGFSDDEAALPVNDRTYSGYRLLQEYFAFAQKFRYLRVSGLCDAVAKSNADTLEILLLLDRQKDELNDTCANNFRLFVVPAINLFEKRHEKIKVDVGQHRFRVRADDIEPDQFEVHSVKSVSGLDRGLSQRYRIRPFYANHGQYDMDRQQVFYTLSRYESKVRLPEYPERFDSSRLELSLVDLNDAPYSPDLLELDLDILVSNVGNFNELSTTGYRLASNAPVAAIQAVVAPSLPISAKPRSHTHWLALDHMTFNFQSLDHADTQENARYLQKLLSLYAYRNPGFKLLEGIRALKAETVTRQFIQQGYPVVGHGISLTLTCDESLFEGTGCYLLGAVLERFFAQMVSINSFVETHLCSTQRGEVTSWTVRSGIHPLL